jgi:hypothetical protein
VRVAVVQSNYIPWKGYFHLMREVDLFVFYDDVQFTRNDWRNRNRIKTPAGPRWLTIPVGGHRDRRICDVTLPQDGWGRAHFEALRRHYERAPYWDRYAEWLRDVLWDPSWSHLSDLNHRLTRDIARELGVVTRLGDSRDHPLQGRKGERLLDLVLQVGGTEYVSGPAAKAYLDESAFEAAGVGVRWWAYPQYPEYPQFEAPFVHEVTVLDLLFHTGPRAPDWIWGPMLGEPARAEAP